MGNSVNHLIALFIIFGGIMIYTIIILLASDKFFK